MRDEKVRFGLIGCGVISPQHFESIEILPEAELTAVCDIKEERAKTWAEAKEVPWYTDHQQLLQNDDIDVVAICTPHDLHTSMGIDVLCSGKHVLMEKPIGITVKEVDKMLEVAKLKKKHVFAVLQVRYNPALQVIKKTIDEKKLGKINHASLIMRWFRPQEYYDRSDWHGTKREGGLLLSQGIHYIDTMRWLFGAPETVFVSKAIVSHDIETEDLVSGVFKFKNGALATAEMTLSTYPRNLECSITILGTKGTVKVSGTALNEIALWEVEGVPMPTIPRGLAPNVYVGGLYQGSCPNHVYVYEDLIKTIKNPKHPHVDGEEARKSLLLADAMYESARAGREVRVKQ